MATPFELSKQGFESQFATNHFAHFLLTMKLLPTIESSQPSRIVNLSSMAHLRAPKEGIKFDLLNDKASYNPGERYGGLPIITHRNQVGQYTLHQGVAEQT